MNDNLPTDVTKPGLPSQNTENQRKEALTMPRRAISDSETLSLDASEFARELASLGGPSYLFSEVRHFPGVTALVDVLEPIILAFERAEWLLRIPSVLKAEEFDLRIPEVTPAGLAGAAMRRWRLTEAGVLQRLDEEKDDQLSDVIRCLIAETLYRAVRARFKSWPESRVDPDDVAHQIFLENHEKWIRDFDPSVSRLSTYIFSHARQNAMSIRGQRSVGLRPDPPLRTEIDLGQQEWGQLSIGLRPAAGQTDYHHQEDDIIARLMSEVAEAGMSEVELLRYHGFSFAEIGQRTGLSAGAARTRYNRSLKDHRRRRGLDPRGRYPRLETEGRLNDGA